MLGKGRSRQSQLRMHVGGCQHCNTMATASTQAQQGMYSCAVAHRCVLAVRRRSAHNRLSLLSFPCIVLGTIEACTTRAPPYTSLQHVHVASATYVIRDHTYVNVCTSNKATKMLSQLCARLQ